MHILMTKDGIAGQLVKMNIFKTLQILMVEEEAVEALTPEFR